MKPKLAKCISVLVFLVVLALPVHLQLTGSNAVLLLQGNAWAANEESTDLKKQQKIHDIHSLIKELVSQTVLSFLGESNVQALNKVLGKVPGFKGKKNPTKILVGQFVDWVWEQVWCLLGSAPSFTILTPCGSYTINTEEVAVALGNKYFGGVKGKKWKKPPLPQALAESILEAAFGVDLSKAQKDEDYKRQTEKGYQEISKEDAKLVNTAGQTPIDIKNIAFSDLSFKYGDGSDMISIALAEKAVIASTRWFPVGKEADKELAALFNPESKFAFRRIPVYRALIALAEAKAARDGSGIDLGIYGTGHGHGHREPFFRPAYCRVEHANLELMAEQGKIPTDLLGKIGAIRSRELAFLAYYRGKLRRSIRMKQRIVASSVVHDSFSMYTALSYPLDMIDLKWELIIRLLRLTSIQGQIKTAQDALKLMSTMLPELSSSGGGGK